MRVVFLTQDDPLYILPFFEEFFHQPLDDVRVTSIFACRAMGNRKRSKLVAELLRLYGPLGFARLATLQLISRAASALHLGSIAGSAHSIRELAEQNRIPYRAISNPNAEMNARAIAAEQPDVIVSVACPFVLKKPLLELPGLAALNIHHAPLPRYKGMMPTFWQMYHGETSVGITIHTMAEALDAGDILEQRFMPIQNGETMHQLIRRSKRAGAHAMKTLLSQFAQGIKPQPLATDSVSSYFTFPTAVEMRHFRERGLRAI